MYDVSETGKFHENTTRECPSGKASNRATFGPRTWHFGGNETQTYSQVVLTKEDDRTEVSRNGRMRSAVPLQQLWAAVKCGVLSAGRGEAALRGRPLSECQREGGCWRFQLRRKGWRNYMRMEYPCLSNRVWPGILPGRRLTCR